MIIAIKQSGAMRVFEIYAVEKDCLITLQQENVG